MNTTLWIVQGLLAVGFLLVGGMKLFAYEKFKKMTEARSPGHSAPSKELAMFIGISEVVGAIGLILPAATGIEPILTTLAAVGLGTIMFLAVIFHLRRREPASTPIILFVLAAFVVVGRGF
jgi:uncharacterized membrane protein YphA (DoxX/SURF4 family)